MGYIDAEDVKTIRENLKKQLPEFKLSVTRSNHSGVNVCIMEGPSDLGDHKQINHYYAEKIENADLKKVVEKILATIYSVKSPKYRETGDYGSQPDFYIHLRVGKWDKPYSRKET